MTAIVSEAVDTGSASASGKVSRGSFTVSISGLSDSTATVQRSYDSGSTWLPVESFTVDAEKTGVEGEGADYRVNITSGTDTDVAIRIGQKQGPNYFG